MTEFFYAKGSWDVAVARRVAKLADLWRRATGRSHFVLCRLLIFLGVFLGTAEALSQRGIWFYVNLLSVLGWAAYILLRAIPLWERNSDVLTSEAIPVELVRNAEAMRLARWYILLFVALDVAFASWLDASYGTVVATALFMITSHGAPPDRVWYQRLAGSLRDMMNLRPAYAGSTL
jgi:hypothetical protein